MPTGACVNTVELSGHGADGGVSSRTATLLPPARRARNNRAPVLWLQRLTSAYTTVVAGRLDHCCGPAFALQVEPRAGVPGGDMLLW
jgi:hypothetical protein